MTMLCASFSLLQVILSRKNQEKLLESALSNRYYSVIRRVTEDQYECASVINIKRLGKKDEFVPRYEVKLQFLTFQGAHNPRTIKLRLLWKTI